MNRYSIKKRRNATTRAAIRAAINAAILGNAGLISKNSAARMTCGLINIAISTESDPCDQPASYAVDHANGKAS